MARDRASHPLLPPCDKSCRISCQSKFTQSKRREIHDQFWDLPYQRRRDWLASNVIRAPKQRGRDSRRHHTVMWKINQARVCKPFFLKTLGYTSDKVVRRMFDAIDASDLSIASPHDKRGKHVPPNKFSPEFKMAVTDHIESYRPAVSHYRLEHAPNRRYLPSSLDVKKMHREFVTLQESKRHQTCSYRYYFGVFSSMNISFATPSQDRCTKCSEHATKHTEEEHDCTACPDCDVCQGYELHRHNAKESRKAMHDAEQDAISSNGRRVAVTVDMQKAILMPQICTKDYYFSRKLVLFNETFAPVGDFSKQQKTKCMLWHEGEAGRKAFNIANAYIAFLKEDAARADEVTFFTDNCNSQNKNWLLFSVLQRVVNDKDFRAQLITFNYLEVGHTYMSADSVHGSIGTALKCKENIYDMRDYLETILQSRGNMEATLLDHSDQILFKSDAKARSAFPIKNMKSVQFRRGSTCMYVRDNYDRAFIEVDFLTRDAKRRIERHAAQGGLLEIGLERETQPRGISSQKKKDLLKLCRSIPEEKRKFFLDLHVNNCVADLETVVDTDMQQ